MIEAVAVNGEVIYFDPALLASMYKAIAVRITANGQIEVLVPGDEGWGWVDVTEADDSATSLQ